MKHHSLQDSVNKMLQINLLREIRKISQKLKMISKSEITNQDLR